MSFGDLMRTMTQAACAGEGNVVAACFADDGTYHDVFYGSFTGREAIAGMIEDLFHRDGERFRWDLHEPVSDGSKGYVRYVFSYTSKLPDSVGKRALFEGIAHVDLKDGLIADYHEVTNAGTGLQLLGFPPERLAKFIGRQTRALADRDEAAGHLG